MKNIKTYNLFLESRQDHIDLQAFNTVDTKDTIISDDINDILLPLKDMGIKWTHQMQYDNKVIVLYITSNT